MEKSLSVPLNDIDAQTFEITDLRLPKKVSLLPEDRERFKTIRQRIINGARKVWEVMSAEERDWLQTIDVEAQIQFVARGTTFSTGADIKTIKQLSKKPVPTLADDLVADTTTPLLDPKVNAFLKSILRSQNTQRFVLSESAAVRVGEAINRYPEMLVDHGWFARAPFDTCWIELPGPPFHEAVVPGSGSPTQDDRVGYLFHNGRAYVGASAGGKVSFSPLIYHLHSPNTLAEQIALADDLNVSRAQLDNFYWGATMAQKLPLEVVRGLRSQHGFELAIDERVKGRISGEQFLGFSAGEVRNLIGLLLMINQPSGIVREMQVSRQKQMTFRGNRVLMSHSVVTLNLDRKSKPDRLLRRPTGTHASPRWHNVIDHWCNDKVARTKGFSFDDPKTYGRGDHAHLWDKDERPDGGLVATCAICGGRRWRRKMTNGRGDRSRGTIAQTRVISTHHDTEHA